MPPVKKDLSCFKAYDIRGRVPAELDPDLAYSLGRAYCALARPKSAVVGHDIRLSSPDMADALTEGLCDGGAHVFFLGPCGTEEVYFAGPHLSAEAGFMVTASHNPKEWNGIKLVGQGSAPLPVSGPITLAGLKRACASDNFPSRVRRGHAETVDPRPDYIARLVSLIDSARLRGLTILCDAGNGCAGPVIDALAERLPATLVRRNAEPDGNFPNGVPNPLLPENRAGTSAAVVSARAQFGLAWDGDFDRCFFFDERGAFVEGYYMVALLAEQLLAGHPGEKIVHDPRLYWNTRARVEAAGGIPVLSKTGHVFMKQRMRAEGALYGGEMSAHHYFRDFHCCDSGMLPWLLVAERIGRTGEPLSAAVAGMAERFPVSGEINRAVRNVGACLAEVEREYAAIAVAADKTDGLSLEFADWRFNLRGSNTEPLMRLNVESRANPGLLAEKTAELLALIDRHRAG